MYRQYPESLRALLLDAASHRAKLLGRPYPLEHENAVVRSIIRAVQLPSIGTLLAISILANVTRRRASDGYSGHWDALQHMIRGRGGLAGMQQDELLFTKLTWSAIALTHTSNGFVNETCNLEGRAGLDKLLRSRMLAAVKGLPTSPDSEQMQEASARFTTLQQSGRLGKLLLPILTEIELMDKRPSAEQSCQMAILVFFSLAIEYYGDFSSATAQYFDRLSKHLEAGTDDSFLSSAHLLWSMIRLSFRNSNSPKCMELWVTTAKMTTAWNMLETNQRHEINQAMYSSLVWTKGGTRHHSRLPPSWSDTQNSSGAIPGFLFCELLWFTAPQQSI